MAMAMLGMRLNLLWQRRLCLKDSATIFTSQEKGGSGLTWNAVAKEETALPLCGRMMVPEVMRRPKPSWWANA